MENADPSSFNLSFFRTPLGPITQATLIRKGSTSQGLAYTACTLPGKEQATWAVGLTRQWSSLDGGVCIVVMPGYSKVQL